MTQETSPYDAVIADLETKCLQITGVVEALKQLRTMGVPAFPGLTQVPARNVSESEIPHDAFFQMTIPDAAKKYMTLVKRTKPMADIIEALMRGGLKSSSKNVTNTIRSILSREGSFVRVNGEWGLAEWYPAIRRDSRKTKVQSGVKEGVANEAEPAAEAPGEKTAQVQTKATTEPPIRERVLSVLRTTGNAPVTANLIADRTGLPLGSVRARLSAMVKHGEVERVEAGQYRLSWLNQNL